MVKKKPIDAKLGHLNFIHITLEHISDVVIYVLQDEIHKRVEIGWNEKAGVRSLES